jgi:hypothetical protein
VLRLVAAGTALAAAATVLAGCAGQSSQAEPPVGTVVMIIRHGEKPDKSEGLTGIDASGNKAKSSLTAAGWERARSLVDVFAPEEGPPRAGLTKPTAIFASGSNSDGEGARTRETIAPLAEHLGVTVNTDFGKGDESAMVAKVLAQPGPTLICWQHGEIPAIADSFKTVSPTPPSTWPDDRYDVIWTLTKTATGWNFAQLPEMAQPGDQTTTIAG